MKRIRHILELIVLRIILIPIKVLPIKTASGFAGTIGYLIYLLGIRKRVSKCNLDIAFGDNFTDKEKYKIIRKSYNNFCRSIAEFALMPRMKGKLKNIVEIENPEVFNQLTSKVGALLVSGHYGSWELMAGALSEYGYPIDLLVGVQNNKKIDNLMNNIRRSMGVGLIPVNKSMIGVVRALKKKRFIAMLSDQDAGGDGEIIQFFTRPASTPKGPALFSYKMNCPIIAGVINRLPNLRFKITVKMILPNIENEKEDELIRLTQEYTSFLEDYIKEYPDQYFWAHKRYKSTLKGIYR